jgi:anthranilate synthase/aminodeoxychorismate synthase-like glutamine amidotransferase
MPDGLVISPGPGKPDTAGISLDVVTNFAGRIPILGVCLGHQCIGQVYGGTVVSAPELMHGKTSMVYHGGNGVFADLPSPMSAIRYHSLTLDPSSMPDELEVTARTESGVIMGLRHRRLDIEGVQFHPESVMTPDGPRLIANWLHRVGVEVDSSAA